MDTRALEEPFTQQPPGRASVNSTALGSGYLHKPSSAGTAPDGSRNPWSELIWIKITTITTTKSCLMIQGDEEVRETNEGLRFPPRHQPARCRWNGQTLAQHPGPTVCGCGSAAGPTLLRPQWSCWLSDVPRQLQAYETSLL